ncbi:MAG: GIY-YIG nuclease family protein [Patescibacteria group bacterium]
MYVGKAKSLKKRVSSYFTNLNLLSPKTKILISKIKKIKTISVASEIEALLLEANYIKKYKPKYNVRLTDGKAYPLIRITVDKYPKVLIARKAQDKKSIYFGPFPNAQALRLVLKTVRKIFPFQSTINHQKKLCLYYHLGLCPCPEVVGNKEYRSNINHLITFLNGKTKKVVKDLKKERDNLSKLEEFEKAALIQKKLDAIKLITNPAYNQFDHKVNPNLTQDTLDNQLSSLRCLLSQNGIHAEKLERIECYDISNIQGKSATGSMVVFINGDKDSSLYRRFKIKNFYPVPNDFAMIKEVIGRRLNHKEWPMPDLIIVDGGKGQVSSALMALKEKGMQIPVIGLAKREETIIIPLSLNRHSGKRGTSASRVSFNYTERRDSGVVNAPQNDDRASFVEIFLPKDSPVLHLTQRIRDEAHRFAIFYHRKLRSNILYK